MLEKPGEEQKESFWEKCGVLQNIRGKNRIDIELTMLSIV